jgi:hypothetical protein
MSGRTDYASSVGRVLIVAAGAAVLASMLAACGAETGAPAEATLESWRKSACALESEPVQPQTPPDPSQGLTGGLGEPVEEMRALVKSLRAIPAPDEHRDDIERLIELVETGADQYEAALPRIRAASRRLEQAMASIDESELPPLKEPMTVAGGIMTQMMSVPAVKEAFEDMMAAYKPLEAGFDEAELKRLTESLGLDKCPGQAEPRPSASELDRCGSRGKPVSLEELIRIFRRHGISLELDEDTCVMPVKERGRAYDPDATNAGPSGLSQPDQIEREQGHVMCTVADSGVDHELVVNKYSTDTETSFVVHNVDCVLYPYSTAVEAEQVARVKKAMKAVSASVPTP